MPRRDLDMTKVLESSFKCYCRTLALGSGAIGSQAKLVCLLNKPTPMQCLNEAAARLKAGRIDEASYRNFCAAVEGMEDCHHRGMQTHMTPTPENDWRDIGGGAHQRKTHIHGL